MGRTLKRVPMDFDWPLGQVWSGYTNPYYAQSTPCPECNGAGGSKEYRHFYKQWYGNAPFDPVAYGATPLSLDSVHLLKIAERQCEHTPDYYGTGEYAVRREVRRLYNLWRNQWNHHLIQADVDALLEAGRLMDFTHVPRTEEQREIVRAKIAAGGNSWLPEPSGYRPTADEVNEWSLEGMAHDGLNAYVCCRARCEREGVPDKCSRCADVGRFWPTPEIERLYEAWSDQEPPTGEGYQLWETTTEGSPSSPVFSSIEELCAWCADNATTFGSFRASADEWRTMLDQDFVHHTTGNMTFI
jgi:hypothetical protein